MSSLYGDVGRIISMQHAQRVVDLVDTSCNIIYGGEWHNVEDRFVAPTVIEATAESIVMKYETFGPVLSIITATNLDGAIRFVNEHYSTSIL